MKQTTAKTPEEVRDWVETTPHHKGWRDGVGCPDYYLVLEGHDQRLRIPADVLEKCKLRPGDEFDRRMYRWDD